MTNTRWGDVLTRISRDHPENLDELLRVYDPRSADPGTEIFPEDAAPLPFELQFKDETTIVVGVRVRDAPADAADLAVQLGTFALERDVEVVVLSHLDYSGLERFGFRTERISGETEAARNRCERQLASFWNLEVII